MRLVFLALLLGIFSLASAQDYRPLVLGSNNQPVQIPSGSTLFCPLTSGLDASKPSPASGNVGQVYWATDTTKLYRSDGSAWTALPGSGGGGATPTGTGFVHVTSGTQDGAAKTVDTIDITNGAVTGAKIAAATIDLTTKVTNVLPIANGGTNATSAGAARTSLGVAALGANSDITSLSGLATPLSLAQGGTGQATASAAFNALSPMTTLGDIVYGGSSGSGTRLAGNSTTTPLVLISTGTGSAATAPAYGPLTVAMIPNLPATVITSGVLGAANGGTGQDASAAANGKLLIGTGSGMALANLSTGATAGVSITNGAGTITLDTPQDIRTTASPTYAALTLTAPLPAASGGTGVSNAGTLTNAFNTTITGGGTLTLGGFNLTVPATGTAALLAAANTFTGNNVLSPAAGTGSPGVGLTFNMPAHTALTANTEYTAVDFNLGANVVQWTGGTGIGTNRFFRFRQPAMAATSATTFVGPTTVTIDGPPTASTNATVSGALSFLVNAGNSQFSGTILGKVATQNLSLTQGNASSGVPQQTIITGGSHTNLTASTETPQWQWNYAQTLQHAAGALPLQRHMIINAPTYSFATSSSNLTDSAVLAVTGPPIASTNCVFVNQPSAIWAQTGQIRAGGNLMTDSSTAPAILQDGQLWLDSTQQSLVSRQKGASVPLVGTLFSSTATATVANSTVEGTILGTGIGVKTLPVGYLVPGKTLRLTVSGLLSNAATDTQRIKVKAGSTVILDTAAQTITGTQTNTYFTLVALITCRTSGASGTVIASGKFEYSNGLAVVSSGMANTTTTTIDTTATQAIDATAQAGGASSPSASDSISGQVGLLESLN